MGWTERTRDFRNVRLHQKQAQEATESCEVTETQVEDKWCMMAGDKLGRPCSALLTLSIPHVGEFLPRGCDAAQQHLILALQGERKAWYQGERKAWCLEELALSAGLFMPIAARSVCPSSWVPQLLGSPGMWPMWYLEKNAVPSSELGLTRRVEQCQPPGLVCPVGVFLFGWADLQKGNIKSWHINKHIKILGEN